jgi:hypothetical protein
MDVKVSIPYKTGEFTVLYILIFMFSEILLDLPNQGR